MKEIQMIQNLIETREQKYTKQKHKNTSGWIQAWEWKLVFNVEGIGDHHGAINQYESTMVPLTKMNQYLNQMWWQSRIEVFLPPNCFMCELRNFQEKVKTKKLRGCKLNPFPFPKRKAKCTIKIHDLQQGSKFYFYISNFELPIKIRKDSSFCKFQ